MTADSTDWFAAPPCDGLTPPGPDLPSGAVPVLIFHSPDTPPVLAGAALPGATHRDPMTIRLCFNDAGGWLMDLARVQAGVLIPCARPANLQWPPTDRFILDTSMRASVPWPDPGLPDELAAVRFVYSHVEPEALASGSRLVRAAMHGDHT
jgi:hypothetical protein